MSSHAKTKLGNGVKVILFALFSACILVVLLDFLFLTGRFDKHAYFEWENWPGFYAIYGFIGCVVLVLISKYVLRPLVKRDEDYYE